MDQIYTVADIENNLAQIYEAQENIRLAEIKRDQSIAYYQSRIEQARKTFDTDTADARHTIDNATIFLKRFCDEHPPVKGKSHKFAGGSFGYHKQSTVYTFDDKVANADNPGLLEFVKNGHEDFLRVKESVDWSKLKNALTDDGDTVYLKDTGETIDGMKAFPQPDKFVVKTKPDDSEKVLGFEWIRGLDI